MLVERSQRQGDGLLLLRSVQLPGKRVQTDWNFANGLWLRSGEQLGNGSPI